MKQNNFVFICIYILIKVSWSAKQKKRNSQCEHGQLMEQTIDLFCTCYSGVARCLSQHQCHFWRMHSMFAAIARTCELGSCQSNLCHS